jgi:prepilin-type N-terminal cleavage/methylation domain-containing protein
MMNYLKCPKAFTLLEMTIVIAIIGVLMLVAIPNYRSVAEAAQKKSCTLNKKLIAAQADNYFIDKHVMLPPDDETTLVNEPLRVLVEGKYLREVPECPTAGEYKVNTVEDPAAVTCSHHS